MTPKAKGEPTHRLVLQRVRNRIIDYLELASSFDEQREYQGRAPVHVPHEVINQWADWVRTARDPAFAEPVFSPREQDAIAAFHDVWAQVVTDTPNPLPALEVLVGTAEWRRLQVAAAEALAAFAERGRLSEEHETE